MMIGATRDDGIIDPFLSVYKDSWGPFQRIDPSLGQEEATAAMVAMLKKLKGGEPLCFFAHGNDTNIGDAGSALEDWDWDYKTIAELLKANAPAGGYGPIMFGVCCKSVANFSAHVAVALGEIGVGGVWCYGFNRIFYVKDGVPSPSQVLTSPWVQGTMSKAPKPVMA